MATIAVRCEGSPEQDWTCTVTLGEALDVSTYHVNVKASDLARLAPAAARPEDLVERSFAFLLEREPPTSILRSFDLLDIARYFPEYEADIKRRIRLG